MKKRYRLIRRSDRGGKFYVVDTLTGKRESLSTFSADEAEQIVMAKNQARRQPMINLQIAKAYLAASDTEITKRTWQQAFEAIIQLKHGPTKQRWERAAKEKPF